MSPDSLIRMPFAGQTQYSKLSQEALPSTESSGKKWKYFKTPFLLALSGVIIVSSSLFYASTQIRYHANNNYSLRRTKIGVSHEADLTATNTSQLPMCTRTFLYKFTNFAGLGSELGLFGMAALTASMTNYTILIDDSIWNYGRLSDYFDLPPLPCQPPQNWLHMPRPLFSNKGLNESDHVYSNREERDGCTRHILEHVDSRAIDAQSVWNFVNHRDQNQVLPAAQNLHHTLQPMFDLKSAALRNIWRPNKMILEELRKMKEEFNEKMLQTAAKSGDVQSNVFTPGLSDPDSPLPNKLISVHFRLGDKKAEVDYMHPAATGGIISAYAKAKPYLDIVRSFVPEWKTSKNLPTLFVFSDDAKQALDLFDEHQSYYYPYQRFPLLSSPKTKMITEHGFDQGTFNVAPLAVRKKLASALIRDVTFAVDHSEAIVCSLSSNICNMMFHLRGSQDAAGRNPSVRSVDVRWHPTAFLHELNSLSLDPVKDRDRVLALAPRVALDEYNYINI